jgi:perosamine synthetase
MINIYNPDISNYTSSAIKAIQSGWISNLGDYINLAKEKLKNLVGCKYVMLTNNGTTSTHCVFMALKYKYPNLKKIYVPNNVYIAVWNSVLMEYDLTNIEVLKTDIETYNFDMNELDRLEKNACLVIVHNVGNIIDVSAIKSKRPDLILVEDNCEGLFGRLNDKYTGNCEHVLASSCSFYGNKVITSGEGGAFFTNDEDVFNFVHKSAHQGMTKQRYIHDVHGYNYRMTNVQAAFLYDQLNDIDNILEKKAIVFNIYDKLLGKLFETKLISKQKVNNNCTRAYWMYIIRVHDKNFDSMFDYFKSNNIDTRPFFYPIHFHEHLKSLKIDDENSTKLSKECIMIPSSPGLTINEQKYIVKQIAEYLKENLNEEQYKNIINFVNNYEN